MLGGGGVDGAIHQAAGPALLEACRQVKAVNGIRCPTGEARITEAGNLPSRYVIHTVGPRFKQDLTPEKSLISAYQNSLQLALDHQCRSIALPAISCGVYGYPLKDAAHIALKTCKQPEFNTLNIYFYLFGTSTFNTWKAVIATLDNTKND